MVIINLDPGVLKYDLMSQNLITSSYDDRGGLNHPGLKFTLP